MDFEIISQECFLGDPLPKLLKLFRSAEQNDRQAASVAQLDALPDWRPGRQHSFMEIDHEIFSTVIFSLPLIPEGQLSVSG